MRDADSSVLQFVTFRLDGELFALPLASVTEVMRMVAVTALPDSPAWLAGVINVRGDVVPVVDLRRRLNLPIQSAGLDSRIIVVDMGGRAVALIADSTANVLSLPAESVRPPDELTRQAHPVEAMARDGDQLVPVLDLRQVALGLPHLGSAEIPGEEQDECLTSGTRVL